MPLRKRENKERWYASTYSRYINYYPYVVIFGISNAGGYQRCRIAGPWPGLSLLAPSGIYYPTNRFYRDREQFGKRRRGKVLRSMLRVALTVRGSPTSFREMAVASRKDTLLSRKNSSSCSNGAIERLIQRIYLYLVNERSGSRWATMIQGARCTPGASL